MGNRQTHPELWLLPLLAVTTLEQTAVWAVRPLVSYRALALDAGAFELGIIASCFASLAIIITLPLGRLIDRFGERPLIMLGAALTAASCMAVPLLHSIPELAIDQAVLGGGQILVIVAGHTALANRGSEEGRAWRVGLFMSAGSLGQVFGPAMAGLALGHDVAAGRGEAFVGAAVAALLAVALGLMLPFRARRYASASHATDDTMPALLHVLKRPGLAASLVAGAAALVSVDLMTTYLPAYGVMRGITPEAIVLALAVLALAQVLSRLCVGWLVGRVGHLALTVGSLILAAVTIPWLVLPIGAAGMTAVLAIAGLGLGLCPPLTFVWVAKRTPAERQGSVMSLRMGLNRLGELIVPPVVGVFAGYGGILIVMWCVSGILAGATVGIVRSRSAISSEGRREATHERAAEPDLQRGADASSGGPELPPNRRG